MKLVITVVHDRDKNKITEALLRNGFTFTKMASTGGFLREGNVTLLIGVEGKDVDRLVETIRDSCKTREQFVNVLPPDAAPVGTFMPSPVKVMVGGAVCFVMDVERFERF
jgi:uncharacterized protein YaaQ